MILFLIFLIIAFAVAGFWVGRRTVPQPLVVQQRVKVFGLKEAEEVARQLGGLNRAQAMAVKVTAAVGDMEFRVGSEAEELRVTLENHTSILRAEIERYKKLVTEIEKQISENDDRFVEVSEIADAFE